MKPIYAMAVAASFSFALAACDDTSDVEDVEALVDSEALENEDAASETEVGETGEEAASDKVSGDNGEAAQQAEIKAFIDSIFAGYTPDGYGVDLNSPADYFDPELAAAIKAEQVSAAAADDIPMGLDADPFCNCQDWGEFSHTIDSITVNGSNATAKVTISNMGAKEARTISLIKAEAGWRVSDLDGGFRSIFL